jgi:hypothetical protein
MTSVEQLAKALQSFGNPVKYDEFVVIETKDSLKIARIFGVAKVSVVVECKTDFSEISKTIVKVGKQVIKQGQTFFVKVYQISKKKHDFTARDIEFAATGQLSAMLSGIANPASAELQAKKTIAVHISNNKTFVALKEYEGIGGSIAGSLGIASCPITGVQSLDSCVGACRAGFEPELLILYSNTDDLRKNAKLAARLAEMVTQTKKDVGVTVAKISPKGGGAADSKTRILLYDLAAAKIQAQMRSRNSVLSISLATHPQWFVELIMGELFSAGKIPLAPLMFSEAVEPQDARGVTRKQFMQIDMKLENPKQLNLKVGPNYLHDIIDSVQRIS